MIGRLDGGRVIAVQEIGALQYLLFEQPWPLAIALLIVTVVLTVTGRRRKSRALRITGGATALLAGAVVGLAWQIDTGREQLDSATQALVEATTSPMQAEAIERLLADDAVLLGPDGAMWFERSAIRSGLEHVDESPGIASHHVRSLSAKTTGANEGQARLALSTRLDGRYNQRAIPTTWMLRWRRGDDGAWRVYEIQWQRALNQPAQKQYLPN